MNEFPVVFEPEFMTIYLLVIIGIFSTTLALSLEKYKFTIAGKALIGMCFISLFVLFVYIWVGGDFFRNKRINHEPYWDSQCIALYYTSIYFLNTCNLARRGKETATCAQT